MGKGKGMKKKALLVMSRLVFFLMIFSFIFIQSMDFFRSKHKTVTYTMPLQTISHLTEDIFNENFLPILDLKSVINFGNTCKTYHSYCLFEKICKNFEDPSVCDIKNNYFYSTCVLSYFARQNHKAKEEDKENFRSLFKCLWAYHTKVRYEDMMEYYRPKKRKKSSGIDFADEIAFYYKHYSLDKVRKQCDEQLKKAILEETILDLKILMENQKRDLCKIFDSEEKLSVAVDHLCAICFKERNTVFLWRFIDPLNTDGKKIIIDQVFYNGNEFLLCDMLAQKIIIPQGEYLSKFTPLHYAAYYNYTKLAVALLHERPDGIHAVDDRGDIPLYHAMRKDNDVKDIIIGYYSMEDLKEALFYYMDRCSQLLNEIKVRSTQNYLNFSRN